MRCGGLRPYDALRISGRVWLSDPLVSYALLPISGPRRLSRVWSPCLARDVRMMRVPSNGLLIVDGLLPCAGPLFPAGVLAWNGPRPTVVWFDRSGPRLLDVVLS
jgi:hypothetical protein